MCNSLGDIYLVYLLRSEMELELHVKTTVG